MWADGGGSERGGGTRDKHNHSSTKHSRVNVEERFMELPYFRLFHR